MTKVTPKSVFVVGTGIAGKLSIDGLHDARSPEPSNSRDCNHFGQCNGDKYENIKKIKTNGEGEKRTKEEMSWHIQ